MKNLGCSILLLTSLLLQAQHERPVLTLKMKNGDVLTGISDLSSLPFKTPYGDLAFPIKEVQQITLGVSTAGINKKEVEDQCDRLQNYSLTEAAIAFDKLIKMEAGAVVFIKDYIGQPTYKKREGELSVDLAYEVLLARQHLPRSFSTLDKLQTNGNTVVEGSYNFDALTLETDYGRLSIARSKINSIAVSWREVDNANSGTFKLLANQHISGNTGSGWLNTGLLVKQGQLIKILADGVIHLASISNNAYTPDGGVNGSPGAKSNELLYGSLIFKIGENGNAVKAGDNYNGKAAGTGILYLSIYESVFNAANTGSYTAKIVIN